MAKLFEGKKLYITLNVIMLVITASPLLFYPTAWVGFLVSCLYVSFAARSFAVILTAAIVTNLFAFLLAAANDRKAVGFSIALGFIGGLAGSFAPNCDSFLSKSLRCIFIIMIWVTAIAPTANILLHQYDVLPMLM